MDVIERFETYVIPGRKEGLFALVVEDKSEFLEKVLNTVFTVFPVEV